MTINEAVDILKQYIDPDIQPSVDYYVARLAVEEVLNVIKPYEKEAKKQVQKSIEQGRDEAWEAARKICCCGEKCLTSLELEDIFCTNYSRDIILQNTASEAISKIKTYEEYKKKQQEENEIHVGDEVTNAAGDKGVVIGISNNDVSLFMPAWNISQITHKACCKKTGRKFPEIAEVLNKLREGERNNKNANT